MRNLLFKRLGVFFLTITIIGSFSLTVCASERGVIYDYQIADDGTYNKERDDYIENIAYTSTNNLFNCGTESFREPAGTYSASIDFGYTMSEEDWAKVTVKAGAADILVTRDCMTMNIDHGHVALACDGEKTVEHYGPQVGGIEGATGLSVYTDMEYVWKHCKTLRVYVSNDVRDEVLMGDDETLDERIVNYAQDNLVGWKYAINANRRNGTYVNCATLVWKAFASQGIEFQGYWPDAFIGGTFLPSDFVIENPDKLTMELSIGWGHDLPNVWGATA